MKLNTFAAICASDKVEVVAGGTAEFRKFATTVKYNGHQLIFTAHNRSAFSGKWYTEIHFYRYFTDAHYARCMQWEGRTVDWAFSHREYHELIAACKIFVDEIAIFE
jgi:hypothetical protein